MYRKLLIAGILCVSAVGCDSLFSNDEKKAPALQLIDMRQQDFEKLTGHWVFNPAKCQGKIKIYGLLEYTFSDRGLSVGGAEAPLTGTLTSKRISDEIVDLFSNVTTCEDTKIQLNKSAKHLKFNSKNYELSFIVDGSDVWAIQKNKTPYLLERFENIDFKNSEIIEPTKHEMSKQ